MPDISMCESPHCRKAKTCYRHQESGTTPNPGRQTWFMGTPCSPDYEYYYPIYTVPTERITKCTTPTT